MRRIGLLVAALVFGLSLPAGATGNVRIQQGDGSVQTYTGVTMRIGDRKLTLVSKDGVSTIIIGGANCNDNSKLVRCTGGDVTLRQDGKSYTIPFKSATFYFNLTDEYQALPLSTQKVPPHSVIFATLTAKGTHVNGDGKLDEAPAE